MSDAVYSSLRAALDRGQGEMLREMAAIWPFFATRLAMLEMVFAKTDAGIAAGMRNTG